MSDKLNLIETIEKEQMFSTFARLIEGTGIKSILAGPGEFTVFAPTNDAFGKIKERDMDRLLTEKNLSGLKARLSYHILPAKVMAANLASIKVRASVTGENVNVTDFSGLKVNGSIVQARNIEATNGVIHALDTVLLPPAVGNVNPYLSQAKTNGDKPAAAVSAASKLDTGPLSPIPSADTSELPAAVPFEVPAAAPAAAPALAPSKTRLNSLL